MIIACGNQGQWERLCRAIGREDLPGDRRYADMAARNVRRLELTAEIEKALAVHSSAYWLEKFQSAEIPTGPINDYKQVFEHPQVLHRKLRVDMPHAMGGVTSTVASPLRLSDTPVEYRRAPPVLGEHTEQILTSVLGKSKAEIDALAKGGII